jgi:hypothetical protein
LLAEWPNQKVEIPLTGALAIIHGGFVPDATLFDYITLGRPKELV